MPGIKIHEDFKNRDFYKVPFHIYKDDPNWIPPLEKDLESIFDPDKNKAFKNGELKRWVLTNGRGYLTGRVAAFYQKSRFKVQEYPVGGIGFFECVNDQEAANVLFDQARKWLESKGVKGMDGPVNFGERDRFWGLLVKGFTPPSYLENYNPPYYTGLFENYGFKRYFGQQTFRLERNTFNYDRLNKVAAWIAKKREYRADYLHFSKLDSFVNDFLHVYNNAWKHFDNFKPMSSHELKNLMYQMKPVLIEEFIIYIYIKGEPAGIFVMIPDINQLLKYLDGRMDWRRKLRFLWYRKTRPITKLKGLLFGIHPKFQNAGIDALLVHHFTRALEKYPRFREAELSWIGEFNPKMKGFMENLNAEGAKYHITYRKIFDKNIKFQPYSISQSES